MTRFAASKCISCGGKHWGNPARPCTTCLPHAARTLAARGHKPRVQRPPNYCVDCGKRCVGKRCWNCHLARSSKAKKQCVDCGAELSVRRAQRCSGCSRIHRRKHRLFRPNGRLAHRHGRCLDLNRKGFSCPINWGSLDHRHCSHCFRPMRPDADQCSGCTALELMAGRIELTAFMPASGAAAAYQPVEGSKTWKSGEVLVLDLDRLTDQEAEDELDRAAREFDESAEAVNG